MTKYRITNDGYSDYLEYQCEGKFLWIFPVKWWDTIPDYRGSGKGQMDYEVYINSYNHHLDSFVKDWPNIENYFTFYKERELEYEAQQQKKEDVREQKRKTVKYL